MKVRNIPLCQIIQIDTRVIDGIDQLLFCE